MSIKCTHVHCALCPVHGTLGHVHGALGIYFFKFHFKEKLLEFLSKLQYKIIVV